jgi:hypothetical protein
MANTLLEGKPACAVGCTGLLAMEAHGTRNETAVWSVMLSHIQQRGVEMQQNAYRVESIQRNGMEWEMLWGIVPERTQERFNPRVKFQSHEECETTSSMTVRLSMNGKTWKP